MPAATSSSDHTRIITPIAEIGVVDEVLVCAIESHEALPQLDHDAKDMLTQSGVAPDDKERT
jgi:hypothetical protein